MEKALFDNTLPLSFYGITGDLARTTLGAIIENIEAFAEDITSSVNEMKLCNYEPGECRKLISSFYEEGWEGTYGGENFYEPIGKYKEIHSVLVLLQDKYDISLYVSRYKNALSSIWGHLPDFYKGHDVCGEKSALMPSDYDSNSPFPVFIL